MSDSTTQPVYDSEDHAGVMQRNAALIAEQRTCNHDTLQVFLDEMVVICDECGFKWVTP